MKIAVIPARGGSKRIPRKNIREFAGMPMIEHSIRAAQNCRLFERIIVSTDDLEISEIALGCGAEVPQLRSAELSDDSATTVDVMAAEAARYAAIHSDLRAICCVYATAPLMDIADIVRGWNELEKTDANYSFSVAAYAFPIQRAIELNDSGGVRMCHPEHRLTRSQDLTPAYHDAGQFYWGLPKAWISKQPIYSDASRPVIIPHYRVQDIDTEDDWFRAEAMYRALQSQATAT